MPTSPKKTAPAHHAASPVTPETTMIGEKIEYFFQTFVVPFRYHFLLTVIAVLLVVSGVRIYFSRQKAVEEKAFLSLSEAKDLDEFKGVAEDYPDRIAGFQAEIEAARKAFADGKYDQAAAGFARVAGRDNAPSFLRAAARLGEAYALEGQGKFQEAEKRFAALAESLDDSAGMIDAYLAAGRCAAAQKRFAEAEKWYKQAVTTAKGDTTLERLAKEALEGLNTQRYAVPPVKAVATPVKAAATPVKAAAAKPVKPVAKPVKAAATKPAKPAAKKPAAPAKNKKP
jgi:tetratricopeptide (TPR) repeat protein